ncbi:MAG: sigma-54-dependent Fis family transcriptional regulator [Deltaproteobacteria bacterium]|nr:sigma-54-dependent Fis family transcriptional regulator [Deltaproteobacteria bacterium]
MSSAKTRDPWPRLRDVVASIVTALRSGRFIEEGLEALFVEFGATSAWSTLETKSGAPMHRSRTAGFRGVSPAVLAQHVTEVLSQVQSELRTIAGYVPYATSGSFAAVPLWGDLSAAKDEQSLAGAMYLEFPNEQAIDDNLVEFIEFVGALLGALIAQQTRIEATREDLRVERAKDHHEHYLDLEELLAPSSMDGIRDDLEGALASNASILIVGESGTGKTQLATAFARASRQEPIVRATLGHSDDLNTITSELFGHERGAFSGAVSRRKGLVEYANEGTLILDEVLNLPGNAQQLLLDFTQFGTYRPLGYQGRRPKRAALRLISVTNGDMSKAISKGQFRGDLYYRIATVPVVLPPLRERRGDIARIAVRYLNHTDTRTDWELSGDAMEVLLSSNLQWAGNIRELESVMERARNRARRGASDEAVIEAEHLGLGEAPMRAGPIWPGGDDEPSLEELHARWKLFTEQQGSLDALERLIVEDALRACNGIVAKTARVLGMPRTGLISRIATFGIDVEKFKEVQE